VIKIGAVSGDLVVKLALAGAAVIALVAVWKNFNLGDAARTAGNAVVDNGVTGPLQAGATAVGSGLVGIVNATGLSDYLKSISTPDLTPGAVVAPGVVDVDGQSFNFNF
jgi:hypothetical protein